MSQTDAVRLLTLVGEALAALADGAQARIQLELALVKAAAPQMEASTSALLARIERLEAALAGAAVTVPTPIAPRAPATGAPAPPTFDQPQAGGIAPGNSPKGIAPGDPPPPQAGGIAPGNSPTEIAAGNFRALLALWPAVVDMVRGENLMLATALGGAWPVALSRDELTVEFPAGADFSKRMAEQDDYRRVAADALRRITGQPLALRFELGAANSAAGPPATQPARSGVISDDDLVRAFVEEFNAQELGENKPDEDEVDH